MYEENVNKGKFIWYREGGMKMLMQGERINFVCVFGGLWKIGEVKWLKSGYRTKGLIRWAGLSRFADISTF